MQIKKHTTWYWPYSMVSAKIIPLVIPSKIDTWVYIDMLTSAGLENKKARIYAGFRAIAAFVY
jgi:hypothetical protein